MNKEQITKDVLIHALDKASGNRRIAASDLNVTERHVYRLMKKHELITRQSALEDVCNILNKCGFTLDGGTQDPDYIESSEKYINDIVEKFHTNSR